MVPYLSNAAIITVSNNPNVPGQYTNLQTAIDAAAPDDTLYVQGSTTSYGSVLLFKKLTIIGAGAMPNKSLSLPTRVEVIYIRYNDQGTGNGSGSSISGCKIYLIYFEGYFIENITLSRNHIGDILNRYYNQYSISSGITISNNYIGGTINLNRLCGGSVIKNNIIRGGISQTGSLDNGNWLAVNNIIHYRLSSCTNGVFINNIMYGDRPDYFFTYLTYCDFVKNIFYTTSPIQFDSNFLSSLSSGNNNNSTSGNIINQNPDFVYFNENQFISDYTVSYPANGPFMDYHLSDASPGKNYGTDGTDLGIYGGPTPFAEGATTDSRFRYYPMPAMPQMLDLTITNQSIPANSTLNVNFTAEKKN